MSTILFHEIVFGPIHSRRMGSSLGINLLPFDGKLCSFDCIYCECGFNKDFRTNTKIPDRSNVKAALKEKLNHLKNEDKRIDVITFAGNGEPTIHPDFSGIIDDTIKLRDIYYPNTQISVLTNGMHLNKSLVFKSLQKIEKPIIKLDSAFDKTVRLLDRPNSQQYSVAKQIELIKQFNGNTFIEYKIEDNFMRGFEGVEKFKFQPCFYSQTPEDFHRRLTFLQQCMRQGKSVDSDMLNSNNSVFGRQPISILRIGDFFHTKVIFEGMSIDYSMDFPWDLNPEGMGVQPMIADITLRLKVIGGQSLATPISQLQNALSFNYYANSTFYNKGTYSTPYDAEVEQLKINEGV